MGQDSALQIAFDGDHNILSAAIVRETTTRPIPTAMELAIVKLFDRYTLAVEALRAISGEPLEGWMFTSDDHEVEAHRQCLLLIINKGREKSQGVVVDGSMVSLMSAAAAIALESEVSE